MTLGSARYLDWLRCYRAARAFGDFLGSDALRALYAHRMKDDRGRLERLEAVTAGGNNDCWNDLRGSVGNHVRKDHRKAPLVS